MYTKTCAEMCTQICNVAWNGVVWRGVARRGAARCGAERSGVVVGAGGGRRWVPGGRGRPERRRPRYHFLKKNFGIKRAAAESSHAHRRKCRSTPFTVILEYLRQRLRCGNAHKMCGLC